MPEQTTERYCVLVNGHAVEPGCWVDGHWGQYGPDHLADRAEELGWTADDVDDDPRIMRVIADEHWNAQRRRGVSEPIDRHNLHEVRLRHDRARWVYVQHYPTIGVRLELDTIDGKEPEPTWPASNAWERHTEAAHEIERWLNDHTAPVCPHCGDPMYATSDGFYRHLNFPALVDDGPCEFRAIDEPTFYTWGWHDGEFYLWPTETWEEV